ncbi:hypothetical protein [Lutibacter sp.]|uniref:hypothetical protein n=1 Tax=Lutibacter sp. TaxID=1925666 RepID=UPI001A202256|nr:hypothetical protein [Lutibacter sp.]MBI9040267.1 hypothetical protein [Lutibacter sp.]
MKNKFFFILTILFSIFLGYLFKQPSRILKGIMSTKDNAFQAELIKEYLNKDFFYLGEYFEYNFILALCCLAILVFFSRTIYYDMTFSFLGKILKSKSQDSQMNILSNVKVNFQSIENRFSLNKIKPTIINKIRDIKTQKILSKNSSSTYIVAVVIILSISFLIYQYFIGGHSLFMNNYLIIGLVLLVSGIAAYKIAEIRNRSKWKAFSIGFFLGVPGLIGIIIFLKTKGERTKKNRITERVIVVSLLLLIIGVAITKTIVTSKLNDTLVKYNYNKNLNEDGDKLIHYSMYHDTFIIEVSVEESAIKENIPYIQAENFYRSKAVGMSQEMFNSYAELGAINELKQVGYTSLQVRVLYKDGTIENSKIIELN